MQTIFPHDIYIELLCKMPKRDPQILLILGWRSLVVSVRQVAGYFNQQTGSCNSNTCTYSLCHGHRACFLLRMMQSHGTLKLHQPCTLQMTRSNIYSAMIRCMALPVPTPSKDGTMARYRFLWQEDGIISFPEVFGHSEDDFQQDAAISMFETC